VEEQGLLDTLRREAHFGQLVKIGYERHDLGDSDGWKPA
jgi:hypothetical protein